MCQISAEAFLHVDRRADIGINNGGGCRKDIAKGSFTINHAYEVLPFSNQLETLTMTGAKVVEALEDALDSGKDGAYPYAAGLRFDVDMTKAKGARVTNVMVNKRLQGSWTNIVSTSTYHVVTNTYIGSGKDGYTAFGAVTGTNRVNTQIEYAESLIKYAEDKTTLATPATTTFGTQKYIDDTGCDHSITQSRADCRFDFTILHMVCERSRRSDVGLETRYYCISTLDMEHPG